MKLMTLSLSVEERCPYLVDFGLKRGPYVFQLFLEVVSHLVEFSLESGSYLLDFSVFGQFHLVLFLSLLLQLLLQGLNLVLQLALVVSVGEVVAVNLLGSLHDVVLQLLPVGLAVSKSSRCVLQVLDVVIHHRAFGVQRHHCDLQSFDLDFLFGDSQLQIVDGLL